MHLAEDQKVLPGARISPLSHTLPVGTKDFFLNLACKGDAKFPYERGILARANTGGATSCCLYCNPLST